jgi:hypothetical protein
VSRLVCYPYETSVALREEHKLEVGLFKNNAEKIFVCNLDVTEQFMIPRDEELRDLYLLPIIVRTVKCRRP